MVAKWVKEELGHNILSFSKGTDRLFAPHILGGRYEIDGILSSSGGFGIIFTAKDSHLLGRKVLVKARRYDKEPGLFSYADDLSRKDKIEKIRKQIMFEFNCLLNFKQKAESRMPNVNDLVYDFSPFIYGPHKDVDGQTFTVNDRELAYNEPYIIMQMIDGENLGDLIENGIDELLKERGYGHYRFWESEVLQYALELCTILEGFHRRDRDKKNLYFLYQDLKPENIMLTHDMFLTLIDFGGMTLVMDDKQGRSCSNWQGFGSAGTGTWGFKPPEMNPEMRMLSKLDQRIDIYTLGATVYHLLTSDNPAKFTEEYGSIPYKNLDKYPLTETTKVLIKRATTANREERYQTMNEVTRQIYECFKQVKRFG
ncbi:hypothetical protein PCCS19_50030 [Paenibacillus sp. CCS19]|uniref:serine/threonine protein kinase n=1 Tax=Paenibacillus sp. CCS19 TaxID=3158387 RepID=UPI0025606A4B|nr:hypothetical protein [Paenibacillus cellulosilyticus]GMK41944.1 hypothetical protein PCCS19_50030 [Paenibacillus cellulosilyticus]